MDEETESIVSAILYVSRKSGALVTPDAAVTAGAVLVACTYWEAHERSMVTPELKDSAPWAAYEMKILQLGRALDFVMRKLGCWKGRGPLLDTVAAVAAEGRFGRGRQSFAATLGEHGQGAYGAELVALLADEGLAGYAVKALHRGANVGYLDEVLAAAEHGRPWVQSAARAYAATVTGKPKRKVRSRRPPSP